MRDLTFFDDTARAAASATLDASAAINAPAAVCGMAEACAWFGENQASVRISAMNDRLRFTVVFPRLDDGLAGRFASYPLIGEVDGVVWLDASP